MTKEDRKRRKREMAALAETLVVVFLGDRPLLGKLGSQNGMLVLHDAYPIGMNRMALNEKGEPAASEMEVKHVVNVPQLGVLHWCAYEGITKLLIPRDTPRYMVKDQSAQTQAAFVKAYHDFVEGLRGMREMELAAEQTRSGLVQPASMGDIPKVAGVADIFKGRGRG